MCEDAEEGELPDDSFHGWSGAERVFGWLCLAVWSLLGGATAEATRHCAMAATAASNSLQVHPDPPRHLLGYKWMRKYATQAIGCMEPLTVQGAAKVELQYMVGFGWLAADVSHTT